LFGAASGRTSAFAFTFTFAFALVGFEALHSVEREEGKGRYGMGWRHICIISLAGGLLRNFFLGFVLFCFGYSSSVSVINISQLLYTTKKRKTIAAKLATISKHTRSPLSFPFVFPCLLALPYEAKGCENMHCLYSVIIELQVGMRLATRCFLSFPHGAGV
jgi:hypothetical protein